MEISLNFPTLHTTTSPSSRARKRACKRVREPGMVLPPVPQIFSPRKPDTAFQPQMVPVTNKEKYKFLSPEHW